MFGRSLRILQAIILKVPLPLVVFVLFSALVLSGCSDFDLLNEVKNAFTDIFSGKNTSENNAEPAENPEQTAAEHALYKKKDFYKDKPFITLADQVDDQEGPYLTAHLPEETAKETIVITGFTEPDCNLYINGKKIITGSNGNFNARIQLTPGKTYATW